MAGRLFFILTFQDLFGHPGKAHTMVQKLVHLEKMTFSGSTECTGVSSKQQNVKGASKIGVDAGTPMNVCRPSPGDKWLFLQDKYPNVFNGLGKLKDYQLKLHVNESVQPVIQSGRQILFSCLEKVLQKHVKLEELDVIEKITGPTHWLSQWVAVE